MSTAPSLGDGGAGNYSSAVAVTSDGRDDKGAILRQPQTLARMGDFILDAEERKALESRITPEYIASLQGRIDSAAESMTMISAPHGNVRSISVHMPPVPGTGAPGPVPPASHKTARRPGADRTPDRKGERGSGARDGGGGSSGDPFAPAFPAHFTSRLKVTPFPDGSFAALKAQQDTERRGAELSPFRIHGPALDSTAPHSGAGASARRIASAAAPATSDGRTGKHNARARSQYNEQSPRHAPGANSGGGGEPADTRLPTLPRSPAGAVLEAERSVREARTAAGAVLRGTAFELGSRKYGPEPGTRQDAVSLASWTAEMVALARFADLDLIDAVAKEAPQGRGGAAMGRDLEAPGDAGAALKGGKKSKDDERTERGSNNNNNNNNNNNSKNNNSNSNSNIIIHKKINNKKKTLKKSATEIAMGGAGTRAVAGQDPDPHATTVAGLELPDDTPEDRSRDKRLRREAAVLHTSMAEIVRQVSVHCVERGRLLADVWNASNSVFRKLTPSQRLLDATRKLLRDVQDLRKANVELRLRLVAVRTRSERDRIALDKEKGTPDAKLKVAQIQIERLDEQLFEEQRKSTAYLIAVGERDDQIRKLKDLLERTTHGFSHLPLEIEEILHPPEEDLGRSDSTISLPFPDPARRESNAEDTAAAGAGGQRLPSRNSQASSSARPASVAARDRSLSVADARRLSHLTFSGNAPRNETEAQMIERFTGAVQSALESRDAYIELARETAELRRKLIVRKADACVATTASDTRSRSTQTTLRDVFSLDDGDKGGDKGRSKHRSRRKDGEGRDAKDTDADAAGADEDRGSRKRDTDDDSRDRRRSSRRSGHRDHDRHYDADEGGARRGGRGTAMIT